MSKVCGECNEGSFLGKKFIMGCKLTKHFGFDICKDCEPTLRERYREYMLAKNISNKRGNTIGSTGKMTPVRNSDSKSTTAF